jgi:DNA-binding phage protein
MAERKLRGVESTLRDMSRIARHRGITATQLGAERAIRDQARPSSVADAGELAVPIL